MTTLGIILSNLVITHDGELGAFGFDELVLAAAGVPFRLVHVPLAKATESDILTQQGIEGRVDVTRQIVTDEDDGVETIKDHTDLCGRVPTVLAACGHV